jgi:sec-independent protein translocase protein TatA
VAVGRASAREIDPDRKDECQQERKGTDRPDACRGGEDQRDGDRQLGERQEQRRRPGQAFGDTELPQGLARSVPVRELRERRNAEYAREDDPRYEQSPSISRLAITQPRAARKREFDECAWTGPCYRRDVPLGGGIGIWEIVLLVVLAIVLFGAKKLPELGRSAGRGLREFKDSATSFRKPIDEVKDLVTIDDVKDIAALRSPKTALSRMLLDKPSEAKTPAESETRTDT